MKTNIDTTKYEIFWDDNSRLTIRPFVSDGCPIFKENIKIYSQSHMTVDQVMKIYHFMKEHHQNLAVAERIHDDFRTHIVADDNMTLKCGDSQILLSDLPKYDNLPLQISLTKFLGKSDKICERLDKQTARDKIRAAKADERYQKREEILSKVRDKLTIIYNHGGYVYDDVDLKDTASIKQKYGHKLFETDGIADKFKEGYNWRSWEEVRPIYRLNSKDEVVMMGAAVYSANKWWDEYENHPAKYYCKGFITASQYQKRLEKQEKQMQQTVVHKSTELDR